jgi:hypothetical protein
LPVTGLPVASFLFTVFGLPAHREPVTGCHFVFLLPILNFEIESCINNHVERQWAVENKVYKSATQVKLKKELLPETKNLKKNYKLYIWKRI